jgi:linalool 8-monooxygenase
VHFPEFLGNMILAFVGANETTRNSLSHTMVNFAARPEQWDRLRAEPDLLKTAVREMVRHASPVMHMRRTATQDTQLGGKRIAKGDKVVMWYTAANRDETVFETPTPLTSRAGTSSIWASAAGSTSAWGRGWRKCNCAWRFTCWQNGSRASSCSPRRAGSGRTSSTGSRTSI